MVSAKRVPPPRRPVSRRLMLALFVLMIVPISGWYFIGDLSSQRLLEQLPAGSHEVLAEIHHEIRFKLAITLVLGILMLAAVIAHVRRTLLDPLERLAEGARRSATGRWSTPPEVALEDEVGDLARALDRSLGRLQRRAEEAERFAADLSHELRTPLAAIRGSGEILAEPGLSEEDRLRFAGHVVEEGRRLERLVNGLLDLARAERASPADEPLLLVDLVQEVAERCEPLLANHELVLDLADGRQLPPVRAQRDVAQRVLVILLENAVCHSPLGGRIRICMGETPKGIEVAVEDEGPGVAPELHERVFERCFSTAAGERARRGTGLGLAIARALVERLGGGIAVSGSSMGGARFTFSLPRWDGDHV